MPSSSAGTMGPKRVVVTGFGVVCSAGLNADDFFNNLFKAPEPGIKRVQGFDPLKFFDPKSARRVDRFAQFAVAAATEALTRAEIDPSEILPKTLNKDSDQMGSLIGTGVGGISTLEEQILINYEKGSNRVSPFLVPMMMPNAASATISLRWGLTGPSETITTACAAGTHSIAQGARWVASGRCQLVITGGAEASLTPTGLAAFSNMTALSKTGISRPFDKDRDGFVIAEGSGVLILEDLESAKSRNAPIYAEILGAGSTADAYHITAPSPNGEGARQCMLQALTEAQLKPEQIGHINAHGTSTPLNDKAEADAIRSIFRQHCPPVTSIKGVTGHSLGAAGAIEAVSCVLTIQNQIIPPTVGFKQLGDGIDLNIVKDKGMKFSPQPILSNSFGFGGHNACLVIAPYYD